MEILNILFDIACIAGAIAFWAYLRRKGIASC